MRNGFQLDLKREKKRGRGNFLPRGRPSVIGSGSGNMIDERKDRNIKGERETTGRKPFFIFAAIFYDCRERTKGLRKRGQIWACMNDFFLKG